MRLPCRHGKSRSSPFVATVGPGLRTIGNILWLVLAGFWLAVGYAFAGLVLVVTIIGIPFGRGPRPIG